jgi:hypothetical protein
MSDISQEHATSITFKKFLKDSRAGFIAPDAQGLFTAGIKLQGEKDDDAMHPV